MDNNAFWTSLVYRSRAPNHEFSRSFPRYKNRRKSSINHRLRTFLLPKHQARKVFGFSMDTRIRILSGANRPKRPSEPLTPSPEGLCVLNCFPTCVNHELYGSRPGVDLLLFLVENFGERSHPVRIFFRTTKQRSGTVVRTHGSLARPRMS